MPEAQHKYNWSLETGAWLGAVIRKSYDTGLAAVITKNKESIGKRRFTDEGPRKLFEIDHTSVDTQALKNFKIEAFKVANVGIYELEEKLKELAIDVTKRGQDVEEFQREAKKLMAGYMKLADIPPDGYLKQNYLNAVKSAFSGAQWIRLQDPSVSGLYPAYMYMTRGDSRVRPAHAKLHKSVFQKGDPALKYIWPPNDWGCRCDMIPLDQTEASKVKKEDPYRSPEEMKKLLNEGGVAEEFRRNPGDVKSIWDKWLKSRLKEMDTTKIYNDMKAYADANKVDASKIKGFDKETIAKVNESNGKWARKPQKDYDNDVILVGVDQEYRSVAEELLKKPHEVWGETKMKDGVMSNEIYYIRFTIEGLNVMRTYNGTAVEVIGDETDSISKYRKGTLIYKKEVQ